MKIISTRPCLHLRTNLGSRIAFWGPDLGHILVPVSGSILGHRLGPYNYKQNPGPQDRAQKWNPKQGPKYDPNHSAIGLLGDLIQLCSKPTTSTKEGTETWAGKIAQRERMNTFADQT